MFKYTKSNITFYVNKAPNGFIPLWDVEYVAKDFSEIKNKEKYTEDELSAMSWFFEDLDSEDDNGFNKGGEEVSD